MTIWILEGFFVKADLINEIIGITSNNCRNEVQHMSIASILPFLEKDYQKEKLELSLKYITYVTPLHLPN